MFAQRKSDVLVRLAFVFTVWLALPTWAVTWKSDEFNCAIELPANFHQVASTNPAERLSAGSLDGKKSISLTINSADRTQKTITFPEMDEVKRRMIESGATIISDRIFELGDLWAGEIAFTFSSGQLSRSAVLHVVIAEGNVYQITVYSSNNDARIDTDLQGCLNSFRFLRKPAAPPSPLIPSTSMQIGYWIGRHFFILVPLIGAAWAIYATQKRSKQRRRRQR